jgi:hypothetical protein
VFRPIASRNFASGSRLGILRLDQMTCFIFYFLSLLYYLFINSGNRRMDQIYIYIRELLFTLQQLLLFLHQIAFKFKAINQGLIDQKNEYGFELKSLNTKPSTIKTCKSWFLHENGLPELDPIESDPSKSP